MNPDLWASNRVSVILLPKSDLSQGLLDLAESWMKAWLLLPAVWITPENIVHASDGPPRVTGIVIGKNGRREVDLFEELGRQHFDSIRLIAVQDPHGIDGSHESTLDAMEMLSTYIDMSRPRGDQSKGIGTELLTFNLVFNATDLKLGSPSKIITQKWTANLLVSSEDRPAPNLADSFTRLEEREKISGFVLSNLATAAGLWLGNPQSVYDLTPNPERGVGNSVILMRTFVRGVISDGVSLRVAARALNTVAAHKSPLHDFALAQQVGEASGLKLLDESQLDAAIDAAVQAATTVQDSRLRYQGIPAPVAATKVKIGLWKTVKDFFKFVIDRLRAIPHNIWTGIRNKINRRATKAFYGQDSGIEVDINIDLKRSRLDALSAQQFLDVLKIQADLSKALESPVANMIKTPEPKLWADIRKIVFRLLDGSPAPEEVAQMLPVETGRQVLVVPDTYDVFPDVTEAWEDSVEALGLSDEVLAALTSSLDEDLDIDSTQASSWLDVSMANKVLEHVESMFDNAKAEIEELKSRQILIESEIENARNRRKALIAEIHGTQVQTEKQTLEELIARSRKLISPEPQASIAEQSEPVLPERRSLISKLFGLFRLRRRK
jgi:hypothetical protein